MIKMQEETLSLWDGFKNVFSLIIWFWIVMFLLFGESLLQQNQVEYETPLGSSHRYKIYGAFSLHYTIISRTVIFNKKYNKKISSLHLILC